MVLDDDQWYIVHGCRFFPAVNDGEKYPPPEDPRWEERRNGRSGWWCDPSGDSVFLYSDDHERRLDRDVAEEDTRAPSADRFAIYAATPESIMRAMSGEPSNEPLILPEVPCPATSSSGS